MEEKDKVFEHIRGEIFATLSHPDGTVEKFEFKNIIVDKASELMARLMAGDVTNMAKWTGAKYLAVGTGNWVDLQNPPPALASATALQSEIERNTFDSVTINPNSLGNNVVEFSTTFGPTEAVGPLVEMGLFGGDSATGSSGTGDMINLKNFQVINKPNGSSITFVWRLTF